MIRITAELGIDEEELSKLLRDLAATTIISLDDFINRMIQLISIIDMLEMKIRRTPLSG